MVNWSYLSKFDLTTHTNFQKVEQMFLLPERSKRLTSDIDSKNWQVGNQHVK